MAKKLSMNCSALLDPGIRLIIKSCSLTASVVHWAHNMSHPNRTAAFDKKMFSRRESRIENARRNGVVRSYVSSASNIRKDAGRRQSADDDRNNTSIAIDGFV